MPCGINSFDNVNNANAAIGQTGDACPEIASNFVGSIFSGLGLGGLFSNSTHKTGEGSGTVACLFGENLSLDSNGDGAGGQVLFGGFSGGGGGGCSSGGVSLA